MRLLLAILGWYVSAAILVSANKVMFGILNLNIPLLVTFIHFSVTSFLMVLVKKRLPDVLGKTHVTRAEFLRTVIPVAVCTAGDVGLSNMAFSRLPISVITVLKSSAPVCIYFAAVVAGIEQFQWRVVSICVLITTSVAFAVPPHAGNADDAQEYAYMSGIIIVIAAVACLSVRWVLIQKLSRQFSPFQLIYLIQPVSALVLFPLVVIFDCGDKIDTRVGQFSTSVEYIIPIGLILGSGIAALILLFCEYQIVHHTTSLTLSISGIGKEVLTLALSFVVFGESFSTQQIIAISASLIGIFLYAYIRSSVGPKKSASKFGYLSATGEPPASSVVIIAGMNDFDDDLNLSDLSLSEDTEAKT